MSDYQAVSEKSKEIIDEARVKQVAALVIAGISHNQISKDMGISRYFVNKIVNSTMFQQYVSKESEDALASAKSTIKAALTQRVPALIAAIDKHLEEGNLEAVKIAFRALGMEQGESNTAASNITVVLPGAEPKEVIANVEE